MITANNLKIDTYFKRRPDLSSQSRLIYYNKRDHQNQQYQLHLTLIIVIFVFILIAGVKIFQVYKVNQKFLKQLQINQSLEDRPLIGFRDFFTSNIKPTFNMFLADYQQNPSIRSRFRLSRSHLVSIQEKEYVIEIFTALQKITENKIYENIYINGDTSYTIDKKNIYMCLKNWDDPEQEVVPLDVLVFVFLHECAHVACRDPQHSNEFWCIFRFILDIFCNYSKRSYKHLKLCTLDMYKHPIQYCNGMKITYNPLFDSNTYIDFS